MSNGPQYNPSVRHDCLKPAKMLLHHPKTILKALAMSLFG
jgi:hypothetical protein